MSRREYTKDDFKTVVKLWDTMNNKDIAKQLGFNPAQITYLAKIIRKYYPLSRKRINNQTDLLAREALKELKLIGQ